MAMENIPLHHSIPSSLLNPGCSTLVHVCLVEVFLLNPWLCSWSQIPSGGLFSYSLSITKWNSSHLNCILWMLNRNVIYWWIFIVVDLALNMIFSHLCTSSPWHWPNEFFFFSSTQSSFHGNITSFSQRVVSVTQINIIFP